MSHALVETLAEIIRHLNTRRLRVAARVIKRKMSNWAVKRAEHRKPRRPETQPQASITITAASRPNSTRRTPRRLADP
jgi:CRISPR/Cas system-associated endonuclease Cas1